MVVASIGGLVFDGWDVDYVETVSEGLLSEVAQMGVGNVFKAMITEYSE